MPVPEEVRHSFISEYTETISMKLTRIISFALAFCCGTVGYVHAADHAEVHIEATVEAEIKLNVDKTTVKLEKKAIDGSGWADFTITTEANTPVTLNISGCEGEGTYIMLRDKGDKAGAALKLKMVRGADSEPANFHGGTWKANTTITSVGTDTSKIWLQGNKEDVHQAGAFKCSLNIKAVAQ